MKLLLSILAVIITFISYAQNDTVYGNAYRYLKAYKDKSPFISTTFVFEKIYGEEFYNAYDILSTEAKIKKKVLRYGIWMVDTDANFYINIMRYGYTDMFIKFEKTGNYYYFKAQPQLPAMQKGANNDLYMFGLAGAAVAVVLEERKRSPHWHAVLDFDNDVVYYLTKEYIEELLNKYPELKNDFNNEQDKEDIEVLKLYLERVNEKYKTGTPTTVQRK